MSWIINYKVVYLYTFESKQTGLKRTLFNRTRHAIYKFFIELSLSSKGQNKSELQKQVSNICISTVMAA